MIAKSCKMISNFIELSQIQPRLTLFTNKHFWEVASATGNLKPIEIRFTKMLIFHLLPVLIQILINFLFFKISGFKIQFSDERLLYFSSFLFRVCKCVCLRVVKFIKFHLISVHFKCIIHSKFFIVGWKIYASPDEN